MLITNFLSKSSDNGCKKVLGINWNVVSDEVIHNFDDIIALAKRSLHTKRYFNPKDPLGLISPIVIQAKLIFQFCVRGRA